MATLALAIIAQLAATPTCSVDGMVPKFWPFVVKSESHGDPLALHDDSVNKPYGQSYYPLTIDMAERIATGLMAENHSIGVGLSQLTASSPAEFQSKFKMTIREAFDPCKNMRAGSYWYVERALRIFNSGSPDRGVGYARKTMDDVTRGDPPQKQHGAVINPIPIRDTGDAINDEPSSLDGESYFMAEQTKGE